MANLEKNIRDVLNRKETITEEQMIKTVKDFDTFLEKNNITEQNVDMIIESFLLEYRGAIAKAPELLKKLLKDKAKEKSFAPNKTPDKAPTSPKSPEVPKEAPPSELPVPYRTPSTPKKPETKPAEKPVERPTEKPAEKPAVKPETKPETKPAEKPAVKPETKPETKPAEKPAEKPPEPKKPEKETQKPEKETGTTPGRGGGGSGGGGFLRRMAGYEILRRLLGKILNPGSGSGGGSISSPGNIDQLHQVASARGIGEEAEGTTIRKKIENVGRPKPKLEKLNKILGKQGSIQTKIIDEEDEKMPDKKKRLKKVKTNVLWKQNLNKDTN
jgi:hypothetical protein